MSEHNAGKNESLQKYGKKRHLSAVMQKYSQGMAEKSILKQSCKNILKNWEENLVLGKLCENIYVTPPTGARPP